MNFTKEITILSIFLLLLFSCKKDPEPEETCQHDESFEAMLEWCFFEVGTWWVYEEETSLERDSVYVDEALIDYDAEAFELNTYSLFHEYNFRYRHNPGLYLGESNASNCLARRINRSKTRPGDFVGSGNIANFPLIEGDHSDDGTSGTPGSSVSTLEQFENYSWSGIDFGETAKFNIGICASEEYQETNFYVSKNIGIVRKELPELNQTWNLVDYTIVQ